jgi:transposase
MEVHSPRCAGMDIHKKTVRVCVLIREEHETSHKEFRTYSTTTEDLLDLLDWLLQLRCTHVALEGTGEIDPF